MNKQVDGERQLGWKPRFVPADESFYLVYWHTDLRQQTDDTAMRLLV